MAYLFTSTGCHPFNLRINYQHQYQLPTSVPSIRVNQLGSGQLVLGYPVPVQSDDTVPLALIAPLKQVTETVPEATELIRIRHIEENI